MRNLLSKINDSELMARLNQNDVEAWSELINRYNKIVYSIAYQILRDRFDAEDATQNTFVRLKIYASNYDTSQPLQPWLARIAGGEALRIYQKNKIKNKKESVRMDAKQMSLQSQITDAPNQVDAIEMGHLIKTAMNQLPDTSRVALTLYYGSGLTQTEIANQLGVSQVSISERIKLGIDKLKSILKNSGFNKFSLTPAFFYQNVFISTPSVDFISKLSTNLPNKAAVASLLNADPLWSNAQVGKSTSFSFIKWALLFSILPIIYLVWVKINPKGETLPKVVNTKSIPPIENAVENQKEIWKVCKFSDTQPLFYKWGKIQKEMDKPNELVEGWILNAGENGNWYSKTNEKGEIVFARDSKVKDARDGLFLGSYDKPICFTGTFKCFSDKSQLGMLMNTSIITGEKVAQLNSDNNKVFFVSGRYSEIGTIHGNKGDEIEFKVFIWKTKSKWLSSAVVRGVGGNVYYFLPGSLTHVNEGYKFGIFSDNKIEITNIRYCELKSGWSPYEEPTLQPFKENLPTDEKSEAKVVKKVLK